MQWSTGLRKNLIFFITDHENVMGTSAGKNTALSPDFLVWKFYGKAQCRPKLCGNCAFPQIFHTRKPGEITVFFVV